MLRDLAHRLDVVGEGCLGVQRVMGYGWVKQKS